MIIRVKDNNLYMEMQKNLFYMLDRETFQFFSEVMK
ncbi:unnamed protein product, partial [marine sediment metagenome]